MTGTRAAWMAGVVALAAASVAGPAAAPVPSSTSIVIEYDVRVPMRDGATLSADVYRPRGDGRVPVILVRTPYDNGAAAHVAAGKLWASKGYAYVVQDVRGRGESDGVFYPLVTEADDGADTIEWFARRAWSNGRVGMMGSSYLGWVQLYAAIRKPPALKALIPTVTPPDPDRNFPMQFGTYGPSTLSWLATLSGRTMQDISEHDLRAVYGHRPLYEADRLMGRTMPAWRDWLDHPTRDAYWQAQSFQRALADVDLPMLHVSGWYDDVLVGTTENYAITRDKAHQFLMLGPWGHRINLGRRIGAIDFGAEAVVDLQSLFERWFDRWLKEIPNGIERDPAVRYFVMGANQWRTAARWPLPGMQPTRFYLSSGGRANSRSGDGRLVGDAPGDQPPDRYSADPDHPVMFVTDDAFSQIGGPDDYRDVETRQDVLVYTSDALTAPMSVCGPMRASIVAASSAKDTDWMTKVVAVRPDGFALRLNDGVVRARFRHGRDREVLLTPGAIERYEIDNWSTCIEMATGWRLRLEVASHAFPKFDVNLQTGGPIGKETVGVVATQTVFHDRSRVSYVELPLVR